MQDAWQTRKAARSAAEYLAKHGGITMALELQGAPGAYHAWKRGQGFAEGAKGYEVNSRGAEWLAEKLKPSPPTS